MTIPGDLLLRVACVLASLAFLAGGGANLAGVPAMHHSFAELGLPVWFGYFIGVCEVAGAAALFARPLTAPAAGGLALIMIGAVYYHVAAGHAAQGVPALLLLLLCAYIARRTHASMLGIRRRSH